MFDVFSDIGKNVMKKLIFSEILYYICGVHFVKSKIKAHIIDVHISLIDAHE